MSDPQEQIKRWLAERLKPHGAATKLARHMGVADTAVTRMKNLEPADAKARRQIKPHEIKQIAEFFNELPPHEQMTVKIGGFAAAYDALLAKVKAAPPA